MEKAFIYIGIISCYIFNNLAFGVKYQFINSKDEEIFEISSYDNYYDDINENEIIKVADFFNPQVLKKDEDKYKPLHSYVKQYNQRVAKNKIQIPDIFPYSQANKEQILNLLHEEEPYIAGFKNEINKYYSEISTRKNIKFLSRRRNAFNFMKLKRASTPSFENKKVSRDKHNEPSYDNIPENYRKFNLLQNPNHQEEDLSPLLSISIEEINKYIDLSTTIEDTIEPTDENDYDYEAFKMDYEQQFKKDKKISDKLQHTEEQVIKEHISKKPFEKVTDITKNCTKKDMDYFGFKAIKCLIYNYQHVKDTTEAKRTLSKMWLIVKVWLCIYVCIAIPCWCQRGSYLFYIYQIIFNYMPRE